MEGRRKGEISEDFEKPPKAGEYNPQVYRGWNEKMGKSKGIYTPCNLNKVEEKCLQMKGIM